MLAARRMMIDRTRRSAAGATFVGFFTAETATTSIANRAGGSLSSGHATLLNLIGSYSGAFNPPQSVTGWPTGLTALVNSGSVHGALAAAAVDTATINAGAWPSIGNATFAMGSADIVWVGVNVTNGGVAPTLVGSVGGAFPAAASGSVTLPGTILAGDLLLMLASGGEIGGTAVTYSVGSAVDTWSTQQLDTGHTVQWLFATATASASTAGSTLTVNSNKGTNTYSGVTVVAFR